jgi:hypothetical protein
VLRGSNGTRPHRSTGGIVVWRPMDPATVAQQADALARAWSPSSAPPSWRLTAAIFATLRDEPELLNLTAEIPPERLPPLLFSAATTLLVRRLQPEPLRRSYPVAGAPQPPLAPGFPRDYRAFCLEHRDELRELCAVHRYQMSEPGRCAHLLPGLALAAGGRDVALVDLGTGAGFALQLDRYRYVYRHGDGTATTVGDDAAPVTIETEVRGAHRPPLPSALPRIVARLGVDAEPVDLGDPTVRAWLAACAPPEAGALTRFARAADVVLEHPVVVRRGDAVEALQELIAEVPADVLVCLLDAYVHVFFEPERLARFGRLVAEAGRERDLDWLSLDPLVPLGPGARRSVVDVEVPAAILQRGRDGGVFGVLGRRAFRDGRSRASLLALGHPGGAWLEWFKDR